MAAPFRPSLEQLEDRCVPATWGNPWPDPGHLTLSFAPDGTPVASRTSQLFQTLNQVAPTQQWQMAILRALQTWAVNANINIGLVNDGGTAFGAAGLPQGDPRFGDIRVAAYPMASDVMAITSPYDPTASTWSGDMKFNTSYQFSLGGSKGLDLYTVALHEAAHSLGLADNLDPTSILYQYYQGAMAGPSANDIAALQSIYGPRTLDQADGVAGHTSFATALPLNFLLNPDGSLGIQANGDISSLGEVEMFRVQAPLNVGSMQIVLHTSGLSLLAPKLSVFDAQGRLLQSVVANGPAGGDLTVTVNGLLPLGSYYVKVEGATQDVFGVGSYQLQVRGVPLVRALTNFLGSLVNAATQFVNNTLPLNSTMLTATLLAPLSTQTPSRFNYAYQASLNNSGDVNYYRVQAPQSAAATTVLSVMVWGNDGRGLVPMATVYNADGTPVASDVIVNENGTFALQVTNATPGASYFVKVAAENAQRPGSTGGYFLAAQFGGTAVQLDNVAQGTLGPAAPQQTGQLAIQQTALYHFVLSADVGAAAAAWVRMAIYDQKGNVVTTLTANNGPPPSSVTLLLAAGNYKIVFTAGTSDGSPLPSVNFKLRASHLTDPVGPQPTGTSGSPSTYSSGTSTSPSGTSATSGTSSTGGSAPPPADSKSSSYYYYYYSSGSGSVQPSGSSSSTYTTN